MPATTKINSSNKKSEVELVSERVSKTKKEIEQLKAQLQKLIDDGISKPNVTETKQKIASASNECKSDTAHNEPAEKIEKAHSEIDLNRVKVFKDSITDLYAPQQPSVQSSVTLRRKDKSPSKQVVKEDSPKKIRHYDQEAAREYIKKQKEQRRASLKNKKNEIGFTQDIKKQRLHELRQKSLQLVSKNIQHKRERSRSRDAVDHQECKHKDINGGKVAQIQNKVSAQINNGSIAKSDSVPNSSESKLEFSTKFAHSAQLKNITVRSNLRDLSAIARLDIPKHIQFDVDNLSTDISANRPSTYGSSIPSFQHKTEAQMSFVKSTKSPTITPLIQQKEHNTASIKKPESNTLEKHKAAIKIQTAFRGYFQRKLYRIALKRKQQVKQQATKEVQTVKIESDIPVWLQAPAVLPYPYNFINTVKRKLNLAIKQTVIMNDVAVQNSMSEQKDKTDKIENSVKPQNSLNKNTDLKSFLSHKCLDLDIKAIKPLALTRHSSLPDEKSSVHNTVPNNNLNSEINNIVSDSDTSKNIPDISSEGSEAMIKKQHSSKRAHSSDTDHGDKLTINTEKIKKLKLIHPKRLNFSSASITSLQNSKLNEEISEHITKSDSSNKGRSKSLSMMENNYSGRDSIIASNKCDYSQNKTKQRHIEDVGHLELNQPKFSEHSIETIDPIIPPQDTLNSFRNYMKSISEEKSKNNSSDIQTEEVSSAKPSEKQQNSKNKEISLKTSETSKDNSASKHSEFIRSNTRTEVSLAKPSESPLENSNNKEISVKISETLKDDSKSKHSEIITKSSRALENTEEYSSDFTNVVSSFQSSIPLLKRPTVSLKSSQRISSSKNSDDDKSIKSISLHPGEHTTFESKVKSNQIHLKFEAELHLLNEFNDSLRQIMAMDKSLMEVRNTNNKIQNDKSTTTYHTRDTQTSFVTKLSTDTKISTESLQNVSKSQNPSQNENQVQMPTINYSRGSEISEEMDILGLSNTIVDTNDTSLITTGLELSELKDNMISSSNEETNVDISVSFGKENRYNNKNVCTGLSLEMFEQLIKDEDARIENLKTILKIREKSLVDRTKGELAWLEIQKKHLRDSGQLQEISVIKKKQRGLLIKLEHERHEMQRLKQMQKAASKERKSVLREQRNMIKAQLSNTSTMITKIKRNAKEEKRHSGPLKVYNIKSHSESIRSETSMSRRSSAAEEIISVVSHSHSVVSHVTEEAIISNDKMQQRISEVAPVSSNPLVKTEHVKRSLLMREAALQKRRKAAEELLQWHQRLIEEEEKIAELERAASAIINQIPTVTNSMVSDEPEKHRFKGTQLNLLWYNMTGREEQKFNDHMTYTMSKISLERFCKDAKKYAISRNKSFNSKKSGKVSDSDSSLSAIDVTVTELTQSKPKNNSHIEKSKKVKLKSSHSLSEIASQPVITKDSQEYTSDFESLASIKESGVNTISTNENQKIVDEITVLHSIKSQSSNSKISSGEFSQSDQDIETVAEQSKSIRTRLSETNKNDNSVENTLIKEQSIIEIIDDNTTSTNTSIPDNIKKLVYHDVSVSVDENENLGKESTVIESETNQDSTSKDILTDIEHDDRTSGILELTNNTMKETEETINSSKHLTDNEIIPSENISSSTLNEKMLDNSMSKSSHSEENISKENQHLGSPSIDQIQSETFEDQTIQTDDNLFEQAKDESLGTPDNNQSIEVAEIELSSDLSKKTDENLNRTNEDQSSKSILTNNSLMNESVSKTTPREINESRFTSELDENQVSNRNLSNKNKDESDKSILTDNSSLSQGNNEQLINKTDESISEIKKDQSIQTDIYSFRQLYNKTNELNEVDEVFDETYEEIKTNGQTIQTDAYLYNETGEDQLVSKTNENHLYNNINKDQVFSKSNKNHDSNETSGDDDYFPTNLNKHQVIDKTNKDTAIDELLSKTNDRLDKSPEDLKYNEMEVLSTNRILEQSVNKSETSSKATENGILLENRVNEINIDTIESDDTEIISDEEWHQLSDSREKQNLEKVNESTYTQNVPEFNKSDLEEKEDSIKTISTSTSNKIESPLLLSYGFVEQKESDDQTELEDSPLHEDHVGDLNEDTSEQDRSQNSINTNSNVTEDIHQQDDESKVGISKLFEESTDIEEEYVINNTSANQFASKSEIDLDKTYQVNLEEEHNVDENNDNEEIQPAPPQDEKKISIDLEYIDVKKRVSEILADANIPSPRGDKSPRVQDLYVTAYDVVSPEHSSSSGSPTDDIDQTCTPPHPMYGSDEVEELLKKQLEIEQEIKEIQQQQQKEHLPYLYVREIPNKPPPPYTPPVVMQTPVSGGILPATEKQIGIITRKAADILHKAYLDANLQNVILSTNDRKMMQNKNNIDKNCFEFVFDLCKEAAIEHYKQFEIETGPSWMHLTKRSKLAIGKPPDQNGLEKVITTKVRQWLGYETVKSAENIKRKWSGRKRDHVDELLVVECQKEEAEWTNYDRDELIVKDELTKDIMNMLLSETAQVFNNILNKKNFLS